ncbi:MAG: elongation factor P [Candidatus Omnitrophota bacterium]
MITPRDFRTGVVVNIDGQLFVVLKAQHYKPGKGGAFVRAKLRNLNTGLLKEGTMRPDEKYEEAYIEEKEMQYLYGDESTYHFMDNKTFEQIAIDSETLGDATNFLKENNMITAEMYKGKVIGVRLPIFVVLEITHTEPGFKGDTSRSGTKPATLETGAMIQVPLFVETGAKVKIDTRTGDYVERA